MKNRPKSEQKDFSGHELEFLIDPISIEKFYKYYWDQKSLYVPGEKTKFKKIYDQRLIDTNRLSKIWAAIRDEREITHRVNINPEQIPAMLAAGMTVCADNSADSQLVGFLQGLKQNLGVGGGPAFSGLYMSHRGGGFPMHFDPYHIFVCQISGNKTWYYGETPAFPVTINHGEISPDGLAIWTDGAPILEADGKQALTPRKQNLSSVTLKPGDLLYLPAGTWHETGATTDSVSLSLSPPRSSALSYLVQDVENNLSLNNSWRRDLLGASFTHTSKPNLNQSEMMRDFFASQVKKFQRYAATLDPAVLHRSWCLDVEQVNPDVTKLPDREASNPPEIKKSDRFRRNSNKALRYLVGSFGSTTYVLLYHKQREWYLPEGAKDFIRAIATTQEFKGEDAFVWDPNMPWDEAKYLLAELVKSGVITQN